MKTDAANCEINPPSACKTKKAPFFAPNNGGYASLKRDYAGLRAAQGFASLKRDYAKSFASRGGTSQGYALDTKLFDSPRGFFALVSYSARQKRKERESTPP